MYSYGLLARCFLCMCYLALSLRRQLSHLIYLYLWLLRFPP